MSFREAYRDICAALPEIPKQTRARGDDARAAALVDLAVRLLARGAAVGNAEARLAPSRNGSLIE